MLIWTELCKIGTEDQNEWYFFSHKDKKYPTGTRTNRATKAGFWKATGRDKAIYSRHSLIGMRKTLVFYKGRAPNGQKSDWIMHEYRLETNENGAPQVSHNLLPSTYKLMFFYIRRLQFIALSLILNTSKKINWFWLNHIMMVRTNMKQNSCSYEFL